MLTDVVTDDRADSQSTIILIVDVCSLTQVGISYRIERNAKSF